MSLSIIFYLYLCLHIISIICHARIMWMYEQVCGKCDWWYDRGAQIMFATVLIPLFGPMIAFASHVDITRNIILELSTPDAK